ncbi:MAG: hypothetical protein HZB38_14970 [Planctomycetes bacterium]|nr:hypothetical protein [Planctomycetota bacterium]
MRRFLSRRVLGEFLAVTGSCSVAAVGYAQQPAAQPDPKDNPAPSTQPAKPDSGELPAATQRAMNDRLRRLQEMRAAASQNGKNVTDAGSKQEPAPESAPAAKPATPPASNRWRERNAAQTQPVVNPEEIRRRAMEARNRAAAGEAQSQPVPAVPQPAGGPEGGREIEPQPTGRDVVVPSKIPDVQHPTEPTTAPPAMEEHKPETAPLTPATVPTTRPPARPARFQPKPATAPSTPLPGAVPPPGDASAKIDQPAVVPPAADGKSDWIAFKDMPWEDVVRLMAKRIGKPLREDIGVMPGGSLTYENPRVMTKEEALDELNYLLVEAGYYLFETRYYVYCVPLNEIRRYLDPSRIFDSIEEFAAAKPRDMELVDVKILIKDMPAEKIRDALAPALPDYAMPTVVAGTNSISITGLGKDVRRFELLHSRIDPREMAKQDPRQMKVYGIKTNVLVIERMVRDLLDVEQPQRKFNPQTRQFEVQGGDSATKIIADERTNTLIVKATPAEHDKVQALIDQFDKVVDIGKFKTTVVEIKNGNAQEIATLLNNIFSQERGQQQPGRFSFRQPVVRQPNQPGQPGQPGQPNVVISGGANPEDIIVEDIFERAKKTVRITADDRSNSLIIYANDEGLARVNEMLEIIDKPVPSNYRPFATKYVDPSDLQPVIEQIARSAMVPNRSGRGSRQPSVIADDGSRILHVVAEKEDMERIAELIGKLDVPAAEQKEHRIQLTQLKPSDMAQTVQGMLSGAAGGGSPRPGRQGGQPRRGGSGSTAQVIALDEISTLIVMCTDAEWEKVRGTIELWDKSAVSDKPEMRFITISKGNPDAILQTIGNLYRNYRHPILGQQPVLTDLSGDKLVVQGIKPALDEIEGLVAKLDVESGGTPVVIIPLAAADANTVAQLLAQQFQSSGGRMRGGRGPVVNADGATNSIIYQGDKQNLEIARKFIQDYEKELVGQGSEKRTFVIKFASPDQVLNAVNQFFVNTGSGRLGPKTQVRAALSANQLIVEAPKDKLAAIETMINTIDNPLPQPTTELRPVPGALDINNLAQMMNTMFRGRQRPDRLTFSFGADLTTSMLVMTVPKDALPEVDAVLKQFIDQAGNVELIEKFIPIQHADVNYVADQVRQLLQARSSPGRGSTVADKVKTVVDSRLNRLGVYAPANLIPLVEELVKQIDQVTTGGEIQSIPMQYADAQGAVQTVSNLLAEKLRLNKNLKVTAEPLSNTIFVAGANKGDFDEIKKQAEQIDANALANRPETRIFEIININPWEILNSLNQRFNQAGGGRRQSAMTFNVVAGTKIVAVVPKDRVEDVAAYVKLLDEASPLPPVQGIALKQADAGTVAQILSNLLQPQMQTNKSLRIVPEPLSNTIFVSGATGPLFKDIEKWAGDLDQATLTRGAEIRVFPIKNGVPQEIVSVLNSRYQPRTGVRIINANQPTFTVVATSNIVASAPPEKLEEIAKLIEQLDTLPGSDWPTVTYDLKYVDPNETMQMINNLYRGKGNQGQQPQVSIGNGMLIIRAPQKAQDEIASLIKKIEVDRGDLAVEMFDLKLMRAQELEAKINLFLGGLGMTPKKGQMRPGAFAEPTTNTLIVMAPKEHMASRVRTTSSSCGRKRSRRTSRPCSRPRSSRKKVRRTTASSSRCCPSPARTACSSGRRMSTTNWPARCSRWSTPRANRAKSSASCTSSRLIRRRWPTRSRGGSEAERARRRSTSCPTSAATA